jgi:regulatory protein
VTDRDGDAPAGDGDPSSPGREVAHRVVRLADLAGAGPDAPVASLRGLDPEGEPAPVVDLRAWARGGNPAPGRRPRTFADAPPPAGGADGERGTSARPARRARQPRASARGDHRTDGGAQRDHPALDEVGHDGRRAHDASGGGKAAGSRAERERREIEADPVAVAREICLRLLTERARTRQELAQALRKREVPDEAAHAVLERFDEVGLIDDAAFAGQWVRSRHTGRGLARRAIAVELRRKGVADEVAQEALAEVDTAAEEQRARDLVDRKLRTIPADTPERRTTAARRLVGMLARRGYPGGIAYRVVREALAAHGAEHDELGEPDL